MHAMKLDDEGRICTILIIAVGVGGVTVGPIRAVPDLSNGSRSDILRSIF